MSKPGRYQDLPDIDSLDLDELPALPEVEEDSDKIPALPEVEENSDEVPIQRNLPDINDIDLDEVPDRVDDDFSLLKAKDIMNFSKLRDLKDNF